VTTPAQLVRRAYAALAERDYETLAQLAAPDFELDLTDRVLNPATYRGAEGVRQFFAEVDELWEWMDLNVERLIERDADVLALLLVDIKGRGSGLELQSRIAQRWTTRDGLLVAMRVFADPDAALARFEAGAAHGPKHPAGRREPG
jgi:ketosteroid isomerase-like protein